MEAMRKDDYSERIGSFMKLDDERRKVEIFYKEVDDWKERLGWIKKESKNYKEDRYRERLKMINREMEDDNEFDRLIKKNLN